MDTTLPVSAAEKSLDEEEADNREHTLPFDEPQPEDARSGSVTHTGSIYDYHS